MVVIRPKRMIIELTKIKLIFEKLPNHFKTRLLNRKNTVKKRLNARQTKELNEVGIFVNFKTHKKIKTASLSTSSLRTKKSLNP